MNTILVRVDGKGFSKFTKPFREEGVYGVYSPIIQKHMLAAAQGLVERVDGAVGAYTISDEISLLFEDRGQDTWYAGRHDKIVSLTAAYATAYFNEDLFYRGSTPAVFDSRVVDLDEEELSLAGYILDRRSEDSPMLLVLTRYRPLGINMCSGFQRTRDLQCWKIKGYVWLHNLCTDSLYTRKNTQLLWFIPTRRPEKISPFQTSNVRAGRRCSSKMKVV